MLLCDTRAGLAVDHELAELTKVERVVNYHMRVGNHHVVTGRVAGEVLREFRG